MDTQAHSRLPRRLDWDGHALALEPAPGQAVEVWLDQVIYACLPADAASRIVLALPELPNGQKSIQLQLRCGGELSSPVQLCQGQAGLARADTLLPLQPLQGEELLDPATADVALAREVAIIVPVYNAAEAVRSCLDSVLAHTRGAARLIVIDDASSEAAIAPLLASYRGIAGVEILRNDSNLGFTGTVNRGMQLAGRADVVLLNADTEVAAHWLDGLRAAAWARSDTASATAVSDNAGAFSVPELEQENPFPQGWTFAQAALALRQCAGLAYPRLPTGNGFCIYLKRAALDAVGLFDAHAFAQGYGEENDWCQRAEAAGWQHAIAGPVLVRHARSQSFGHERRRVLGEAGMAVLRQRWPRYEADVGATLFSPRRRALDWRVRCAYARPAPLPRLLCWEGAAATPGDGQLLANCSVQRDHWLLQSADAQRWPLCERIAVAAGDDAAARAQRRVAFAQLLQRQAIDRIVGTLPAELAAVADLFQLDRDGAAAANPFGVRA